MRLAVTIIVLLFLTSPTSLTGPTNVYAQGLGYAVAGPAGTMGFIDTGSLTVHAGAGGELFLGKYAAIGAEGGAFDRLMTVSVNGALHAAHEKDIQPFISGGYTRLGIGDGGENGVNAWNVGVGADAWLSRHAGIRFELRDLIRPDDRGATHYWSARVGVAFR